MTKPRLDYESAVATGRGDDGTTGLLFGGDRVAKDDLRTEAYGAVDETVAALGLARAELVTLDRDGAVAGNPRLTRLGELVPAIQRELFVVGAELATNPGARDRARDGVTRVSASMVDAADALLQEIEGQVTMPQEFVLPGETRLSAGLEMARTILRRAERRTVALVRADPGLADSHVLPYLNRMADLLWVLARYAEQAEAQQATAVRPDRRRRPAS